METQIYGLVPVGSNVFLFPNSVCIPDVHKNVTLPLDDWDEDIRKKLSIGLVLWIVLFATQ